MLDIKAVGVYYCCVPQGLLKKRRKLQRRQKDEVAALSEEKLREIEKSRLKSSNAAGPETDMDYRELLQANSTCSATWIHYISFLVAVSWCCFTIVCISS